jgi:predicted ATPase/class 3 adenylate cyclase
MNLPTGTVTFLFTDIEGSTRLWEQHPDAMPAVVARHERIATELIEQAGGFVVKSRCEGDGLFAVFPAARNAMRAALQIQRAFQAEPWTGGVGLKVRIALHSGEAQLRDGDYFGSAVNRCARLRTVAYGGQILLTEATRALVGADLPDGAAVRDHGLRRLRDLQQPEHIFELTHPDLPADHPPLSCPEVLPNNLPRPLTTFIGRERELEATLHLLESTRLLTLTGMGGLGKSRLALHAALDLRESFADGIWLIDVAALRETAHVAAAVAGVLGVREDSGRPLLAAILDFLRSRRTLLLLDNCEHLLDGCAALAEQLLMACPHLKILATSRERLGIGGETVLRMSPLETPPASIPESVDSLLEFGAVRLFVDRATKAAPDFALTERNAAAVVKLCRHLDGIPLAIELAAARAKSLPVEQIAERLDDLFRLLTGGSRTAPPHQQTLRALIDWSYDLLQERERLLFKRLSVFVGGFTLESAECACADRDRGGKLKDDFARLAPDKPILAARDILDLLTQLVDKSLLIATEDDGRARYHLLETLRQYGRERLEEAGMMDVMRRRHFACFLALASEAERKIRGSDQARWMEVLEREHDNLRAALSGLTAEPAEAEQGLKMAVALWWFWHVRGFFTEGRAFLADRLAASSTRGNDRAKALHGAAVLARNQGELSTARALSAQSLEIKREIGDRQGIAHSLNFLATLAQAQGDFAEAQPYYEQSLQIETELNSRQGITASLIGLATIAVERGEYARAERLYQECLEIKRELGDGRGVAASLAGLATVALCGGDTVRSRALQEESLTIRRELGDVRGIASSLEQLAVVLRIQGELQSAAQSIGECLTLRLELGDQLGVAEARSVEGDLLLTQCRPEAARTAFDESLTLSERLGARRARLSALYGLAAVAAYEGDREREANLTEQATALQTELGCPNPLTPFPTGEGGTGHKVVR